MDDLAHVLPSLSREGVQHSRDSRRMGWYVSGQHLCLLTLGRDGVDLIDENDGGRILLGLLKGLPQIALTLSGQLAHDLGAIDQEEEGACLVGHRPGNEGLPCEAAWTSLPCCID